MPRKRKGDHVIFRNGAAFCSHCGQSYKATLPAPIPVVTAAWNAFIKVHANCEKTWTEPEPEPELTRDTVIRVIWWLKNGNRGVSSETMLAQFVTIRGELAQRLYGMRPQYQWGHPSDPSDFNRCHKLLEAVPEFREHLDQLRPISDVWSRLVDNWDRPTEMLKENLATGKPNGMYEFMKELGC